MMTTFRVGRSLAWGFLAVGGLIATVGVLAVRQTLARPVIGASDWVELATIAGFLCALVAGACWVVNLGLSSYDVSDGGLTWRSPLGTRHLAWDGVAGLRIARGEGGGPSYKVTGADGRSITVDFGWMTLAGGSQERKLDFARALEDHLGPARRRWSEGLYGTGRSYGPRVDRLLVAAFLPVALVALNLGQAAGGRRQRGLPPLNLHDIHVLEPWLAYLALLELLCLFGWWRTSRGRLTVTHDTLSQTLGGRSVTIPLAAAERIELRRGAGNNSVHESLTVHHGGECVCLRSSQPDYALIVEHVLATAVIASLDDRSGVPPDPVWELLMRRAMAGRTGEDPAAVHLTSPGARRRWQRRTGWPVVAAGFSAMAATLLMVSGPVETRAERRLREHPQPATARTTKLCPPDKPTHVHAVYGVRGVEHESTLFLPPAGLRRARAGDEICIVYGEGGADRLWPAYAPGWQHPPAAPSAKERSRPWLSVPLWLVTVAFVALAVVRRRQDRVSWQLSSPASPR